MIKVGPLEITNVIFCELVRPEKANKFTLIGVYTGDVVVPSFPVQISFSFFLTLQSPAGRHEIFFRLTGPGEAKGEMTAVVNQVEAGTGALPGPRIDVNLTEGGTFKLEARYAESEWITVLERKFSANPNFDFS